MTRPPDVRLGYFYFEPVSNDRRDVLRFTLDELEAMATRLEHVTRRLVAATEIELSGSTKPDADGRRFDPGLAMSSLVEELADHGEAFLVAVYELQDRLAHLLAVFSGCDKRELIGFRGSFKARMLRYRALEKSMPEAAKQFILLERYLCEFLPLRRTKTHEASLHFALLVDGQPYAPDDVLLQLKGDPQWFLARIQDEGRRFVQKYERACSAIQNNIEKLAEAIRATEFPDELMESPGAESLFED